MFNEPDPIVDTDDVPDYDADEDTGLPPDPEAFAAYAAELDAAKEAFDA